MSVDGVERNDWGVWTDLPAGEYTVCFGPAPDYTPPECQTATVAAGGTTEITGTYTASGGAGGATGAEHPGAGRGFRALPVCRGRARTRAG